MILLPVLVWYHFNKNTSSAIKFSSLRDVPRIKSFKVAARNLPFWLRIAALALIILAMARPQTKYEEEKVSGEGIDIVLCIDVSGSMLAQDFQPNRLDAAKEVATKFIDSRATDRIGLVIFAGESFSMCPITTDYAVLKSQVYNIKSGLLDDGTAIGSGLATALERLRSSKSKSKIVILLTDGENNTGFAPLTAKEIARSLGIKVYTIGVGTEGYAPVPELNDQGQITMQQQKVNIDEKFLRELAAETGGKYFRAKDNQGLSNIYTEIDQLEKSKVEVKKLSRYTEKFYPLVFAALILLLIEFILRTTVFKKIP